MTASAPATTTVAELVTTHAERLARAGVPSPATDARLLARHALGLDRAALSLATTADVPPDRLHRLHRLVTERAARVPLQHLTGEVGFRRLVLRCRPGVFIPRLETEVLAGLAVERTRSAVARRAEAIVVEPCTGTGAIALAVADEVAAARVIATDLSPVAVELAARNLASAEVGRGLADGSTCAFHRGDLLEPVPGDLRGCVDVLVSNPPYLTEAEWEATPPEVREHDPRRALVADEGGHAIVRRLVDAGARWLRPGGWLLVEVHEHRVGTAQQAAVGAGFAEVEIVADLTGRDRFVVARRPIDA